MIDFIARELVQGAWLVALAWCWHVFVRMILPVALDRCPWAEGCEGP